MACVLNKQLPTLVKRSTGQIQIGTCSRIPGCLPTRYRSISICSACLGYEHAFRQLESPQSPDQRQEGARETD